MTKNFTLQQSGSISPHSATSPPRAPSACWPINNHQAPHTLFPHCQFVTHSYFAQQPALLGLNMPNGHHHWHSGSFSWQPYARRSRLSDGPDGLALAFSVSIKDASSVRAEESSVCVTLPQYTSSKSEQCQQTTVCGQTSIHQRWCSK